jgi:hypothetical protein
VILACVVAFGVGWGAVVAGRRWRVRRAHAGDFDPRHGRFLRALGDAERGRGPS